MAALQFLGFLVSGLSMGIISSLFGIGGGALLVPLLTFAFKMDIHKAVAISLAVIVPTSLMGAIRHGAAGNVDLAVAAVVAIGGIAGAYIGAGWSLSLPDLTLKRMFAVFLVIIAARMFFSK